MRSGEAGFSMIEALVAMSVLAVAAAGLLRASEETTRNTGRVNERVLARWVAEDALSRLQSGQPAPTAPIKAWGRSYAISVTPEKPPLPLVRRVSVTARSVPKTVEFTLEGYLRHKGASK